MFYQLGLIGYPVEHSLSPWIHQSFLKNAHLQGRYDLIEVHPEKSLGDILLELKEQHYTGFNVTVPYKQKIMPYLDKIDTSAEHIGAVNTVIYRDGNWIGYNTDGFGFVRALEYRYPEVIEKTNIQVLLIGAGGAARGIYAALQMKDVERIDIANRTRTNALKIANQDQTKVKTDIYSLEESEKRLNQYDIIIQTTDVGMKPKQHKSIISLQNLEQPNIICDIVYQPISTNFLKNAKQRGAKILQGHLMLLFQAQRAFEIWTNQAVSIGKMDEQLKQLLEGR